MELPPPQGRAAPVTVRGLDPDVCWLKKSAGTVELRWDS